MGTTSTSCARRGPRLPRRWPRSSTRWHGATEVKSPNSIINYCSGVETDTAVWNELKEKHISTLLISALWMTVECQMLKTSPPLGVCILYIENWCEIRGVLQIHSVSLYCFVYIIDIYIFYWHFVTNCCFYWVSRGSLKIVITIWKYLLSTFKLKQ